MSFNFTPEEMNDVLKMKGGDVVLEPEEDEVLAVQELVVLSCQQLGIEPPPEDFLPYVSVLVHTGIIMGIFVERNRRADDVPPKDWT